MAEDTMSSTAQHLAATHCKVLEDCTPSWPRFLSVRRAAAYASLSEVSIRRLLDSGKLTSLRPGRGKILIDRIQLDAVVVSATAVPRMGRGIRTSSNAGKRNAIE